MNLLALQAVASLLSLATFAHTLRTSVDPFRRVWAWVGSLASVALFSACVLGLLS